VGSREIRWSLAIRNRDSDPVTAALVPDVAGSTLRDRPVETLTRQIVGQSPFPDLDPAEVGAPPYLQRRAWPGDWVHPDPAPAPPVRTSSRPQRHSGLTRDARRVRLSGYRVCRSHLAQPAGAEAVGVAEHERKSSADGHGKRGSKSSASKSKAKTRAASKTNARASHHVTTVGSSR